MAQVIVLVVIGKHRSKRSGSDDRGCYRLDPAACGGSRRVVGSLMDRHHSSDPVVEFQSRTGTGDHPIKVWPSSVIWIGLVPFVPETQTPASSPTRRGT